MRCTRLPGCGASASRKQGEQDADMAAVAPSQTYETAAPEWVEPEPDDGALHTYTVPATRKPTKPERVER